MTVPWSQNDALFRDLVTEGHAWQAIPYIFLRLQGFDVDMPDLSIREDISKADAWLETYDLRIGDLLIEVKSRSFRFTSPYDWPPAKLPAFLDTTKKWDAKPVKPFAYIFISKVTGGMIATCAIEGAQGRWERVSRWDRVREFREEFYTVGREHLVTMEHLVSALRVALERKDRHE